MQASVVLLLADDQRLSLLIVVLVLTALMTSRDVVESGAESWGVEDALEWVWRVLRWSWNRGGRGLSSVLLGD